MIKNKTYYQAIGKEPIVAKNGMAATSHPIATEVAIEVLKAGGNAMDAAVSACAVQCVVEPQSTGIGGDCFAIFSPLGSTNYSAYNGSGRTPAAADPSWYRSQGITSILEQSPHAVTIPGAVDAWDCLIRDHGRMKLAEILEPAIKLAKNGYKILERVGRDFKHAEYYINPSSNAGKIFMPNGVLPEVGEIHQQPLLAKTLDIIASEGRDGFYHGKIAEDLVTYLQSLGGLHTLEDFHNASGNYIDPISAEFNGYEVYQCPPNGQGIIALMLLKIMERFKNNNNSPLDPELVHREIEAGKLAYHYRDLYLADPDHTGVPVDEMLSHETITRLFKTIGNKAIQSLSEYELPNHEDTVYISVVDKERNCASFINTLFMPFGSGLLEPNSGVLLHNRGCGFSMRREHPNQIAGGKRPLHTIIPAMLAKNGRTIMPFGVMGGAYQAFGHLQFLSRLINYNFDIQQAMDIPRFFPNPMTGEVEIEEEINPELIKQIKMRGHKVVLSSSPIGGSQAIWIDYKNGTLVGGSDPRKDGCAQGY